MGVTNGPPLVDGIELADVSDPEWFNLSRIRLVTSYWGYAKILEISYTVNSI